MRRYNQMMVILAGLILLALPTSAAAQDDASVESPPQPAPAASSSGSDIRLDLAAGMRGGVSGVAGHGFDNDEYVIDNNGDRIPQGGQWPYPEYYGHFGMGGTGGLSLELRLNNFIGIETGVFYSRDNASGYVDKDMADTGTTIARIHSEQNTTAYHVPLLLKLNIPSDFVRPFLGVGIQFVSQISSELEYEQEEVGGSRYGSEEDMDRLNERNQIETSNYPLLAGSAGVEVVAGPVRIPIELRVGYALGYDQAMTERARGQDGQIIYDGVYLGHFGIFAGVLYEFNVLQ